MEGDVWIQRCFSGSGAGNIGTVVAFVCGFGVFRIPGLECRVQSFGEFWSVGVGSFSVEFWIWSWHSVKVGLDFENGPSNDISSNGTYVAVYVCPRKSTTLSPIVMLELGKISICSCSLALNPTILLAVPVSMLFHIALFHSVSSPCCTYDVAKS